MKTRHWTFTVAGRGKFPFDMLRYDCAWPMRPDDVYNFDGREQREVTLCTTRHMGPTSDRWSSFGWTVTEQDYQ